MRARRAARARAIATAIVTCRKRGRGAVLVLPMRFALDAAWCQRHLHLPVARASMRKHGVR